MGLFNITRNGRLTVYSLHSKSDREPVLGQEAVRCRFDPPRDVWSQEGRHQDQIAKKFKVSEDRVTVFGMKPRYGGGRSSGFVSIYDDTDSRRKYDTKTQLFRDKIVERVKKQSRKLAKQLKGKRKRVKGTAKSKVVAGNKKK